MVYQGELVPKFDERKYKFFSLTPAVEGVIISDLETKSSALSVLVSCGSINDTAEGISHFIEHMVHLGSEKFPGETHFKTFLSMHGGRSNAYTATSLTNYTFEIDNDNFGEAADIFFAMLSQPLFAFERMGREIYAVEHEFQLNRGDDSRRLFNLTKWLVGPGHPFGRFSTGNYEALRHVTTEEMAVFYEKHYYAANVSVVIVSNMSVDDAYQSIIEEKLRDSFQKFLNPENLNPALLYLESLHNPFSQLKSKCIKTVPVGHIDRLIVAWPLDPLYQKWRSAPLSIINYCLGHEGPGSILSNLKKDNLATKLITSTPYNYEFGAIFEISIDLTETGTQRIAFIVNAVFSYVDLLFAQPDSFYLRLVDELRRINLWKFNCLEKSTPFDEAKSLAQNVHRYGLEHSVIGPYLSDEFCLEASRKVWRSLDFKNAFLEFVGREYEAECILSDKWYGIKYNIGNIPPDLYEIMRAPSLQKLFAMPSPNRFCPAIEIADSSPAHDENGSPCEKPELVSGSLSKDGGAIVWLKRSVRFKTPKTAVFVKIGVLEAHASIENWILTRLWVSAFKNHLNEALYDAQVSGFNLSAAVFNSGVKITILGPADKIRVCVETYLTAFTRPEDIPDHWFLSARAKLKNRFLKSFDKKSAPKASEKENELMGCSVFPLEVQYKVFESSDFSVDAVKRFAAIFSSFPVSCEALVSGNIAAGVAAELSGAVERAFGAKAILPHDVAPPSRRIKLSRARGVFASAAHPTETNHCVRVLCEVGRETIAKACFLNMALRFVKLPFFDFIRTKSCVGYLVHSGIFSKNEILYVYHTVVSSNADTAHIKEKINVFFESIGIAAKSITDDHFSALKKAAIAEHTKKAESVTTEALQVWREIDAGRYAFDRDERSVEFLESSANKSGFLGFWAGCFDQRKTFWAEVVGAELMAPEEAKEIEGRHRRGDFAAWGSSVV